MLIDIIIPILNEEAYLSQCVASVMEFEMPSGVGRHVYLVDGGSTDRSLEIANQFARENPGITVLHNVGRIQSCGLNLAIRSGGGSFILRLDAHAKYPKDYLSTCFATYQRTKAWNVGGVCITRAGGTGYPARLVQALTTHKFGVGNAGYRLDAQEGCVDTVPYGFFPREVFERIGMFDERLVRCQDYEFNRRIAACGGEVWMNPKIHVHYYNQRTLVGFLKKQFFNEGPYNAYLWFLAPYAISFRHGITGGFVLGLGFGLLFAWLTWVLMVPFCLTLVVYGLMSLVAGIQQAIRFREWKHLFAVPVGLFLFHFCHGLGFLTGCARLALGVAPVQQSKEPWAGAGRFRAYPARKPN